MSFFSNLVADVTAGLEYYILDTDTGEWYESGLPSSPIFSKNPTTVALYATEAAAQIDVDALLVYDVGLNLRIQTVVKGSIR